MAQFLVEAIGLFSTPAKQAMWVNIVPRERLAVAGTARLGLSGHRLQTGERVPRLVLALDGVAELLGPRDRPVPISEVDVENPVPDAANESLAEFEELSGLRVGEPVLV